MTWLELLERSAWAATFILAAAFAAGWTLGGAPAAWRHFLWTAVMAGLLVLPAMVRVMPRWGLATAPAVAVSRALTVTQIEAAPAAPAVAPRRNWSPLLAGWLAGCALAAGRFLMGRLRIRWILRHASEAGYAREPMDAVGGHGVRVAESASAPTAMAVGIRRPVVVLPAEAGAWPVERLRAALLHELMHIERRDLPAQAVAQAACCLYWFHPLAWLAAGQLRREREHACDDAVLGRGMAARDYARHLVESARALRRLREDAMAMTEPSLLEARVRALLDGRRDRRPLNRAAACAMLAALAVVLLPVAAVTVHAQAAPQAPRRDTGSAMAMALPPAQDQEPQTIVNVTFTPAAAGKAAPAAADEGVVSGMVQDPSGARIPNCTVTVRSEDGAMEQSATTDPVGGYQFASLPAGRYAVEVRAPGFKVLTRRGLLVEANQPSTVNLSLVLGSVSEALTITAARPAMAAAPAVTAPGRERIRVGGNVQPAKLLYKVAPVYPEDLRSQGISGTVHLAAIIDKQGYLTAIRPLGGPEGLIAAAVEAASQWLYQPSLLNGEPVQVETAIEHHVRVEIAGRGGPTGGALG